MLDQSAVICELLKGLCGQAFSLSHPSSRLGSLCTFQGMIFVFVSSCLNCNSSPILLALLFIQFHQILFLSKVVLRGMSSKIFLHFSGKVACPLSNINLPISRSRLRRGSKGLLFYGQEIILYSCIGILQISGPEIQVLKNPTTQ